MSDSNIANSVIGMSEAEAKAALQAAGLTFRVKFRNGVGENVISNHNMSRLNLSIDDGKVTAVTYG